MRRFDSFAARPPRTLDVTGADGTRLLVLATPPGGGAEFDVAVTRPDGAPVGSVHCSASLLRPFAEVQLVDAAGVQVGRARNVGELRVEDAQGGDRALVSLLPGVLGGDDDQPHLRLQFHAPVPVELRWLVVAAALGWDLARA